MKDWLNITDAAEHIGVSRETLRRWRDDHKGPPYLTVGGQVFYPLDQLTRWLERQAKQEEE